MEVSQLYIYPIKSLKGIRVHETEIEARGLKYDRRWVLVDGNNRFLSQRELPILAKFSPKLLSANFSVENLLNNQSIDIPLIPTTNIIENIKIWDDIVAATLVDFEINKWFSQQLDFNVRLFYQHESSLRNIDSKYAVFGNEQTSFADGYPVLIIGEASLEYLNQICLEKIPMDRFRPNIVFKGGNEFCEDSFKGFRINDCELFGVKPCGRCQIITINQQTLTIGKEPLASLSKFRKTGNKILFGQNVVVHRGGQIKIGDQLIFDSF